LIDGLVVDGRDRLSADRRCAHASLAACQEMTSDVARTCPTHHPARMRVRGVIHTTIRWR